MYATLRDNGLTGDAAKAKVNEIIAAGPDGQPTGRAVSSTSELTEAEAGRVIDYFADPRDTEEPPPPPEAEAGGE
jgi:hypothetical protein